MSESPPAERFGPGLGGPGIHLEHLHRYQLAATLVRGRVLDLGCGVGYGSRILGGSAEQVIGLDRSAPAIAEARRLWASPAARYLTGDCLALPFGDAFFDWVVCFELIEHLDDPEAVLAEIRRVLRPSGLLLLSTPDRVQYREVQGHRNPYHLRELDRRELLDLLSARFPRVTLHGQSLVAGSRVWSLEPGVTGGEEASVMPAADLPAELLPPDRPMYFVALCGEEAAFERASPPPAESVLMGRLAAFLDEREAEHTVRDEARNRKYEDAYSRVEEQLSTYLGQVRELGGELERREAAFALERGLAEATRATVDSLSQSLAAGEEARQALTFDLEETRATRDWLYTVWRRAEGELEAIRGSKVGRPLWWTWRGYLALRQALVRIARGGRRPTAVAGQGPAGGGAVGLRGLLRLLVYPAAWAARIGGRACGWLFLLGDVARESLAAASRRRRGGAASRGTAVEEGERRSRLLSSPARRPRVLLMMPYAVYPAIHGGGVRLFNLIRRVADHCDLHLFLFSAAGPDPRQEEALEPLVSSLHFLPWAPRPDRDFWALTPPSARLFSSDEAARRVGQVLSRQGIDILQLEYAELGQYGLPRFARAKVVLTEYDIAFRQIQRRRQLGFHRRFPEGNAYGATFADWLRLVRYELAVCRRADQVHLMSEDDAEFLGAYLADGRRRLRVVPNAVDTGFYRRPSDAPPGRGVLFVGNFQHLPNVDAMEFLAEEIWPAVRARRPEETLLVVGAHPSEKVMRYDGRDGIRVLGRVPEMRTYYHRCRVLVAPIRAGSGTRLKILEAFAAGIPVVSTALGAEGIAAQAGSHLLVADRPQEIADEVVRLLEDEALGARVAGAARRLAVERYDWDQSAGAMLRGWDELMRAGAAGGPAGDVPSGVREEPAGAGAAGETGGEEPLDVSVVIPTFRGGPKLERCLEALSGQRSERTVEVICVDSGSSEAELEVMRRHGARLIEIDQSQFNHGLTRDLGATQARGRVLVFINQDAIPADEEWLGRLTEPLFDEPECAAVQGGIREVPDGEGRFFWDSGGDRFYFTRETTRWMERYSGIGFSTVNAAMRRSVWLRHPFGDAPIMEDKKWQKEVVAAGWSICARPDAEVLHSHDYGLRSLWRRCESEGFGWRLLGERYSIPDLLGDTLRPRVWAELVRGLLARRVGSAAELLFPWVRPLALWWGNRLSRNVKL